MNTPSDNNPDPFQPPQDNHAANPYRTPEAVLIDDTQKSESDGELRSEPAKQPAGTGAQWLGDAWNLFKDAPGVWIGMTIVFVLILMVLSFVPLVSIVVSIIAPVFMGGFMIAAHEQQKGNGAEFSHLFAGFQKNTGQLFLIGLLYIAASIVAMIPGIVVMLLAGGMPLLMAAESGGASADLLGATAVLGILLGLLVVMALIVPVMMAYWFAPALVALNDMDAIPAMKLSFKSCLRNIMPFLIYGLVGLALMIPVVITFGLAYIAIGPVLIISYYTSYRSVLVRE